MHNDAFRGCAREGILYPQGTLYRIDACYIRRRQPFYFVQHYGFPKTSRIGQVEMEAYVFLCATKIPLVWCIVVHPIGMEYGSLPWRPASAGRYGWDKGNPNRPCLLVWDKFRMYMRPFWGWLLYAPPDGLRSSVTVHRVWQDANRSKELILKRC